MTTPFQLLKLQLTEDNNYAWSWHCNIAMAMNDTMDSRGYVDPTSRHVTSNLAAARFMKNAFDIDVTKFPQWSMDEVLMKNTI